MIWVLLYGLLVAWTMKRVGPASKASSDARSQVTGRVVDSYTNIHSVKLFAHHDREIDFAREAIENTRQTFAREMRIFTLMDLMLMTQEGMETIAQPITLVDAPDAKPLQLTEGRIEIRGLTHHYGGAVNGLDGLTMDVAPGEKVGIVGRSGAGKSTLVKLLLRFYDAEQGRILIDGQDIRGLTQDSLRSHIGMVSQESTLLHRSVRDNILYGRPDATEAQMIEAAKRAEAHEFILDLSDPEGRTGYDAHVGERGVKLSGGQRQRIALARAILKDAPILVLDEATSALDSEVEASIQEALHRVMKGKTVLAIAHRLSTLSEMDRIIVLDEGHIVEDGTHDDLLSNGGLYAQYWARQSGGFLKVEAAE
jgi:ATP-binding cassette subfamily B multidrug efflux pump